MSNQQGFYFSPENTKRREIRQAIDEGGTVIEGKDAGGRRHYLQGKAIHCGTIIELLMPGGNWQRVRFELSRGTPVFYMTCGGEWELKTNTENCHHYGPSFKLMCPDQDSLSWFTFRWPGREQSQW